MPITADCYVIDVICDGGEHPSRRPVRAQFIGKNKTAAIRSARRTYGWTLNTKTRRALCPTCRPFRVRRP